MCSKNNCETPIVRPRFYQKSEVDASTALMTLRMCSVPLAGKLTDVAAAAAGGRYRQRLLQVKRISRVRRSPHLTFCASVSIRAAHTFHLPVRNQMRRGRSEGLFQYLVIVTALLCRRTAVLRGRDACERISDGVGRGGKDCFCCDLTLEEGCSWW